jgi:hypothetical protein
MTSPNWARGRRWRGRRATGHAGTVVLNSKYGSMLPAFSQQKIGNALGWGLVDDTTHWLGFSPLQIKPVTFANGSKASKWAVVSDFGGTAQVNQYCASYGGPYWTYPWYAVNGTSPAFTYGADYPGAPSPTTARPPGSRPPHEAAARSAPTPLTATRRSAQPVADGRPVLPGW